MSNCFLHNVLGVRSTPSSGEVFDFRTTVFLLRVLLLFDYQLEFKPDNFLSWIWLGLIVRYANHYCLFYIIPIVCLCVCVYVCVRARARAIIDSNFRSLGPALLRKVARV